MKKETSFAAKVIIAMALIGAAALVLWFLGRIGSVMVYFGLAVTITYLLNPFVDKLEKWKVPRALSILALFVVFAGIVSIAIMKFVPVLVSEAARLADNFPEYAQQFTKWYDQAMGYAKVLQGTGDKLGIATSDAATTLQTYGKKFASALGGSAMGFFLSIPGLIVIPVLVFYFLKDGHALRRGFIKSMPENYRDGTDELLDRLNKAIGGFIRGQAKLCLTIGIMAWITMAFVAKLPYAGIMGLIAGCTEFIPYLGPILGMIMPLIVAAFIGWQKMVFVAIIFFVIQMLEGNILAPKIMSSEVGMHPAIIIFILMAGGEVAGLPGMLIALPSAVILKAFYDHFYSEKYIEEPAEEAAYIEEASAADAQRFPAPQPAPEPPTGQGK